MPARRKKRRTILREEDSDEEAVEDAEGDLLVDEWSLGGVNPEEGSGLCTINKYIYIYVVYRASIYIYVICDSCL